MAENDIEELQARIAFHEDAIQEMTKTLVEQQKEIYELREMVRHVHKQLETITSSQIASAEDEVPPPHY